MSEANNEIDENNLIQEGTSQTHNTFNAPTAQPRNSNLDEDDPLNSFTPKQSNQLSNTEVITQDHVINRDSRGPIRTSVKSDITKTDDQNNINQHY